VWRKVAELRSHIPDELEHQRIATLEKTEHGRLDSVLSNKLKGTPGPGLEELHGIDGGVGIDLVQRPA